MQIPFLSFEEINRKIKGEILTAFEKTFDSSWYVLGEEVKKFENAYADFNKAGYCVGVSNGLDALFLSLKALNIGIGDEVIVPSHTFIATLLAVTHSGAKPVPVDVDIQTYNIDSSEIESAITDKTKAIIPVHLYGQPCEMNAIMSIAQKHNLYVVEDNAQAHGAVLNGKLTGSWGHINATSFYPGKNLGALGDGGAITTDDETLAKKARLMRNYGSERKYYHEEAGYNMRLDECQAAFLSVKLKYLNEWTKQRQEIAGLYNQALSGIGDLILPYVYPGASHVYHLYVVRTEQRNNLQQYLNEHGIGTLIHYPIVPHLQPAYEHLGYKKGSFPIAEEIAETCLSLPMWPGMQQRHVQRVSDAIKDFFVKKHSSTSFNINKVVT
jgi:dTDP-4-amino-4,6-dideoxygalactose transaminase